MLLFDNFDGLVDNGFVVFFVVRFLFFVALFVFGDSVCAVDNGAGNNTGGQKSW